MRKHGLTLCELTGIIFGKQGSFKVWDFCVL